MNGKTLNARKHRNQRDARRPERVSRTLRGACPKLEDVLPKAHKPPLAGSWLQVGFRVHRAQGLEGVRVLGPNRG